MLIYAWAVRSIQAVDGLNLLSDLSRPTGAAVARLLCCGVVLRKRSLRLEMAAGIEAVGLVSLLALQVEGRPVPEPVRVVD